MVERDTVYGRHGSRVPVGVAGAAPVPGDAWSGRRVCRPKPHAFRANDAPRDCGSLAVGAMPVGFPATGVLRAFVLRRLTLDVPLR